MGRLLSENKRLFEIVEILFFLAVAAREYVLWKVMAGIEMKES